MSRVASVLALTLAGMAWGETPAPPPKVSADLRAKFWRAIAQNEAAQAQVLKATALRQSVEAELRAACAGAQLVSDENGEPACAVRTEPRPKEK